jgi:hypothetical protein
MDFDTSCAFTGRQNEIESRNQGIDEVNKGQKFSRMSVTIAPDLSPAPMEGCGWGPEQARDSGEPAPGLKRNVVGTRIMYG